MEYKLELYKERCSSLGNLLGGFERITAKQEQEIADLEKRKLESESNPKLALTAIMQSKLDELVAKRDAPDQLPQGAISYLDNVFRDKFWGRKRDLNNKFLEKGNLVEQDVLGLASSVYSDFYAINEERSSTDYLIGKWDNYSGNVVRDVKANYDLKSFDEAELTTLYKGQINGYSIILRLLHKLDYYPKGELIYGLVNNPASHITNEIDRTFYQFHQPLDNNERWIETKRQIERNMIFDIKAFKLENPQYVFENIVLNFDVPEILRTKKFDVITTAQDEAKINSRVILARQYLVSKEMAIAEKLKLS